MLPKTTGDLETPARRSNRSNLTRDRVPVTDGGRDVDAAGADNAHAGTVAEQLRLADDDDLDAAGIDQEARAERDDQEAAQVDTLIDQHEAIDWSAVPGISTPEAATWTTRLINARDALEGE